MAQNKLPHNLEDKNILVSGAAGFVPSHLVEFYLDLGANVYGFDNFVTGSESNLSEATKSSRFFFKRLDVSKDPLDFDSVRFDFIFSLASPASPIDFSLYPLEIMQTNAFGTQRLLDLAKQHKARFLLASTSEVYGDPHVHPQVESYHGNVSTTGPRACYDESKRFAEALVSVYQRQNWVDTRIVRIFNTYGPRMRPNDGRVIPNFINQALRNDPITVYGDGKQTRSFCYVSDLVRAFHNVMFLGDSTPYNIGNPDEYTIHEAAQIIVKALGSSSPIVFKDLPQDDPLKRRPDISKLQAIGEYCPQVPFSEGLKKTVEYFKSIL